ncbi:MAG TPA: SH3 domain-containing protein, partial [Anaerolineales bacterium]|nr:SH3 domain-containing protein [Anaerolineales bacterium]
KEFEGYRDAWKEWFAEVINNNLLKTATLGDWYIVISGGKEMWSFRPERIFKKPTEHSEGLGWVSQTDILHWTGRVSYSEREWKYKLWYEVELTKLDRIIKGWYKADLLEEFVIPEVYVETNDRAGIATLFDMSHTKLRLPADPEIDEARIAKRSAYQYIDVQKVDVAIGWASLKYLTVIPPPLIADYRVTATTLRVRSGPGRDYDIIGNLYLNNIVKGDEIVNDWIHITTEDNRTGWCHGRYLKLQKELGLFTGGREKYRVDMTGLNLRQGPGANYTEIDSLKKDEVVEGLGISPDGNWVQVQRSTRRRKINHNLCGQFCVAALCGVDVIPLLQKWCQSSQRGKVVIDTDQGTVIYDLQEMLEMFDVKSEAFHPEPSVAPATPGYLEKMFRAGKKAIIGTGLTTKGVVAYNASIRHWLVVEDIVRMGNSGWVRVYNSYFNREEIYPYQHIFNTGVATGIGLWVDAPDYHP